MLGIIIPTCGNIPNIWNLWSERSWRNCDPVGIKYKDREQRGRNGAKHESATSEYLSKKRSGLYIPVQELSWAIRSAFTREGCCENGIHVTTEAKMGSAPLTHSPVMAVTQEVITQGRGVEESLQNRVHEARVPQIIETTQPRRVHITLTIIQRRGA